MPGLVSAEGAGLRVAIQGEAGSNSHLAVMQMLGEQELVPCSISAEVFERLESGLADAAVLPIENSLHGAVADHYDLLLQHDVSIVAESELRIRHALITLPGVVTKQIKQVFSHPVALSQCRRFFLQNPQVRAVPAYDTAGSVKQVLAAGDQTAAAIAAPYAAHVYGGAVLLHDLEDDPKNFTRFFHLVSGVSQREQVSSRFGEGPVKMSVAFAIPHQPGSLVHVLQRLAALGADLTRIESRPVPGKPWEYVFFADLRLRYAEWDPVVEALRTSAAMVKLLGIYKAASAHGTLTPGGGLPITSK